jgi:hypothetical protein
MEKHEKQEMRKDTDYTPEQLLKIVGKELFRTPGLPDGLKEINRYSLCVRKTGKLSLAIGVIRPDMTPKEKFDTALMLMSKMAECVFDEYDKSAVDADTALRMQQLAHDISLWADAYLSATKVTRSARPFWDGEHIRPGTFEVHFWANESRKDSCCVVMDGRGLEGLTPEKIVEDYLLMNTALMRASIQRAKMAGLENEQVRQLMGMEKETWDKITKFGTVTSNEEKPNGEETRI